MKNYIRIELEVLSNRDTADIQLSWKSVGLSRQIADLVEKELSVTVPRITVKDVA